MKKISLLKKALILSAFFILFTLLPSPMLNIPGTIAIAQAEENEEDKPRLIVKTLLLVKDYTQILRVYNTSESMSVSFKSNDTDVVTVEDEDRTTAKLKGVGVGKTKVIVTVKEGRKTISTLECEVTVGPPMKSYQFIYDKIILGVGKRRTLGAIIKPNNTTELPIFTSSNTAVATVTTNGRVITKAPGKTVITATIANGMESTCIVIVDASINDKDED